MYSPFCSFNVFDIFNETNLSDNLSSDNSENEPSDNFLTAMSQPDRIFNLNYVNTNARSLRPKITSLLDAFSNLDLTFSVITETWFTDGGNLQLESENLLLGHGINSLSRCRPPGRGGYSHGGVSILYRDSIAKAKLLSYPNPEEYEVIAATLTLVGVKRKFVVIGAYIPPGYTTARGKGCILYIRDLILEIKNTMTDPYIGVFGDFNQWQIQEAFDDYPDIVENSGGNTRRDRVIDRNFCNWHDDITSTEVLPPWKLRN